MYWLVELLTFSAFYFSMVGYPCCCSEPDTSCGECTDRSSSVQVEISGVVDKDCTSCDVDGTYVLTERLDPCKWEFYTTTQKVHYKLAGFCVEYNRDLILTVNLSGNGLVTVVMDDVPGGPHWKSSETFPMDCLFSSYALTVGSGFGTGACDYSASTCTITAL